MKLRLLSLTLFAVSCVGQCGSFAASQPPAVAIVRPPYPGQGSTVPARVAPGDLILIKVSATDRDGTIERVKLFANSDLIAEWTEAPYSVVWKPPFEDFPEECRPTWNLSAVATDDSGESMTSALVSVLGSCTAPTSPAIEIISPADGALLLSPATFQVSAEIQVSTPDLGRPFEFWMGTNLIGSVNPGMVQVSPHFFGITNLTEGDYRISVTNHDYGVVSRLTPAVNIRVVKLGVQLPSFTSDGHLQFDVITAYPGKETFIQSSTNLVDWISLSTNRPSTNTFKFIDPDKPNSFPRFYRVLVSESP